MLHICLLSLHAKFSHDFTAIIKSVFTVNNIDCETTPMTEKCEEGPRPILPYSSMFIFGPTNP